MHDDPKIWFLIRGAWLIPLLLVASCSGAGDDIRRAAAGNPIERIATDKFGPGVEYTPNAPGSLVLCSRARKPTSLAPQRTIDFFVYDTSADKIIFEETLSDGDVSWRDDRHLQITIRPGIVKGEDAQQQPVSYLVDVVTHERTPLSEDMPRRNN